MDLEHSAQTSWWTSLQRILEKVEFFTAPDFHSLTLYFQDKTSLTLVIEPCFVVAANFSVH